MSEKVSDNSTELTLISSGKNSCKSNYFLKLDIHFTFEDLL